MYIAIWAVLGGGENRLPTVTKGPTGVFLRGKHLPDIKEIGDCVH